MKKAFDENVSRAKPRVRLATMFSETAGSSEAPVLPTAHEAVEALAPMPEAPVVEPEVSVQSQLASEVKARADRHRAAKVPAVAKVAEALEAVVRERETPVEARIEAPPEVVEVQTPPAPATFDVSERRERLKERLKAVRENPRPEPLPATVVETGLLAVERIATLQTELTKVKAWNASLTQELESARRVVERATEEARARNEEARRLAEEMAGRVKLLNDLEAELAALEAERDEVLLALQEMRRNSESGRTETQKLLMQLQEKDAALLDSLAEEERIAAELEVAKDESVQLRRALDAVAAERLSLAQQVSDLTRERAELLDARKALEAVHRALSHAAAR